MTFPIILASLAASAPALPMVKGASWPKSFFVGRTEGMGKLKRIFARPRGVKVQGYGRLDGAGMLVLDQTITETGEKMKKRAWRLSEDSTGAFRATLTDSTGPVAAVLTGNDLHIRYRMKGAIDVDQHLVLQPVVRRS